MAIPYYEQPQTWRQHSMTNPRRRVATNPAPQPIGVYPKTLVRPPYGARRCVEKV